MQGLWDALGAIAGVVGGAITIYVGVVAPDRKAKRQEAAARAEEQRLRDEELNGIAPVPGVTDGVPRLVLRVWNVEQANKALTSTVEAAIAKIDNSIEGQKKIEDRQAILERRMNEANGTGRATLGLLKLLVKTPQSIDDDIIDQIEREAHVEAQRTDQ